MSDVSVSDAGAMGAAVTGRFCALADGSSVAYASRGHGSTIVIVPGWLSHLESTWEHPASASALQKLTAGHRLVWYDRLGCGLSDRDGFEVSLDNDLDQLTAVLNASWPPTCCPTPVRATSTGSSATCGAPRSRRWRRGCSSTPGRWTSAPRSPR